MEYPNSYSIKEANSLILGAEKAIFNGVTRRNHKKVPGAYLKRCKTCGVQFNTTNFNYCPICVIRNAKIIDLQKKETKPKRDYKMWACVILTCGILGASSFIFIVGCVTIFNEMF